MISGDLSNRLALFENKRIRLNIQAQDVPHFRNIDEFMTFITTYRGAKLVVLNTVRSAAFLAMHLRSSGQDILHLSTALTPNDREVVLDEVKRRLDPIINYNADWTLVATSCVECGMDFSFRYGFCEMRSFQSYLQLGGRINRNNEFDDSELICFTIAADGFGFNPSFEIPINVFKKQIKSNELVSLSVTNAVSLSFDMECREMGGLSDEICKLERKKAFADVANRFRVIPDDTMTVIADPNVSNKICMGANITARELQLGSVHLRQSLIKQLHIENSALPTLAKGQYDRFLGYMKTLL